jgi:hypothetical protein
MTQNKNTFQTLQEKEGTITFGNDNSSKILRKGTDSLGRMDASTKNVVLIENMKRNILRIIQMCDQEHILIFNSKDCEINTKGTNILLATIARTPNNIYILNDIGKESFCLEKEDVSWLWHKRMGLINFNNLIKINKK